MDTMTMPYKIAVAIATYDGDWTAEQIDAGEAGQPAIQTREQWVEPGPDGPVIVIDPVRIAALEQQISKE